MSNIERSFKRKNRDQPLKLTPICWRVENFNSAVGILRLHRYEQLVGPDKYAAKIDNYCLQKDDVWVEEPPVGKRGTSFIRSCRYNSLAEAQVCLLRHLRKQKKASKKEITVWKH